MSEIERLWDEFCSQSFPEVIAGREIRGICITSVDSFVAGCISTFIQNGGLDPEKIRILENCLEDLEKVMDELNGSNRKYFLKLQALGNTVVKEINGAC